MSLAALVVSKYFPNSASTPVPVTNSAASSLSTATTINVAPNKVSGLVV